MLVRIELQRPCDRIEDLSRCVDVPALLEPGVPGDAEAGELCDLLPAKTGGAPAPHRAKPDLLGPDALAAAAEERSQLAAAYVVAVCLRRAGRRGGPEDGVRGGHH